jgi:hypothetical protein
VERFLDVGHWLPAEAPKEVAARLLHFFGEPSIRESGHSLRDLAAHSAP